MKRIAILGVFLLLGAATLTQAQDRKAATATEKPEGKPPPAATTATAGAERG